MKPANSTLNFQICPLGLCFTFAGVDTATPNASSDIWTLPFDPLRIETHLLCSQLLGGIKPVFGFGGVDQKGNT